MDKKIGLNNLIVKFIVLFKFPIMLHQFIPFSQDLRGLRRHCIRCCRTSFFSFLCLSVFVWVFSPSVYKHEGPLIEQEDVRPLKIDGSSNSRTTQPMVKRTKLILKHRAPTQEILSLGFIAKTPQLALETIFGQACMKNGRAPWTTISPSQ